VREQVAAENHLADREDRTEEPVEHRRLPQDESCPAAGRRAAEQNDDHERQPMRVNRPAHASSESGDRRIDAAMATPVAT
jgi:hypothetical protein